MALITLGLGTCEGHVRYLISEMFYLLMLRKTLSDLSVLGAECFWTSHVTEIQPN